MDEWPELEALGRAMDAWDDWPLSPLYDRAQAVIDAARDVVRNYRETKALVEHYKAMPVDADQVRRAEATKACIEIPVPEGYDEPCPNGCGVYVVKGYSHFNCPKEAGGDRHRDD